MHKCIFKSLLFKPSSAVENTFILSQTYRHVSKTVAGFIYISVFIVNMKTVQNICDRLRSLSHFTIYASLKHKEPKYSRS